MEIYADHRGTFWNWLNIYETYINTRTVIWLIQASTGRCNIVEVELVINIFGDDAHLISLKKVVSKSKKSWSNLVVKL